MNDKFIKIADVMNRTTLGRSSIYKYIKLGLFPKAVTSIGKSNVWVEREIQEWIQERIKARDTAS